MFPVGAIGVAVYLATRQSQNGPRRPIDPGTLVLMITGLAGIIHLIVIAQRQQFGVVDFTVDVVLLLVSAPWFFARRVFIPLGLVRIAYFFGWLAAIRWRLDRRGGAALAAAWALCHRRKPAPALAAFVERRLDGCVPLRGAAVTAAGLLCAARGDLVGARQILSSVKWLSPTICPPDAALYATEWLAVDAAADGRWRELVAMEVRGRTALFLVAVAKRLLGMQPSRTPLVWHWIMARDRLETWPLMRRAWAVSPATPEAQPLEPPVVDGDEAERALAAHAWLLARGPRSVDIAAVAKRWDEALESPALRRRAAERALSLAAPSGESALQAMKSAVESDLAAALAGADGALPALGSGVLGHAVGQVRNQLLTDVETLSAELRQRALDKRALRGIDEWREVIALRAACDLALLRGGPELMRLAFAKVHPDACKLAVWLWNDRKERALANSLFTWLHDLASTVEDADAEALQAKNVACGAI